ncbi:MAG: MucR family transcriptional regulator [Hyphomonadaceae bacterium]|nr:MucR family transcriptional regulator [Hyphomonadaceae bacterium]
MAGETEDQENESIDSLPLAVEIVAAFVSNNKIDADALPALLRTVHDAVRGLQSPVVERPPERPKPAVPINRSVHNDHIVCLEDGKKLKMLKRYLRSTYGMSPDEYRKKWGLPADYPMVAPAYAAKRSEFAKQIGLGKGVRRREDEEEAEEE